MIEDDLDEDVDETIQHYARKKRETSIHRKYVPAIIIIIILVFVVLYFLI